MIENIKKHNYMNMIYDVQCMRMYVMIKIHGYVMDMECWIEIVIFVYVMRGIFDVIVYMMIQLKIEEIIHIRIIKNVNYIML